MLSCPAYPALSGVQLRCGRRQSIPSSSIINCAGVRAILPYLRRPNEPAPLQTLREQACALAVPPDDLDQITAPAAEDEHVPGKRVLLQHHLRLGRERGEPTPHVGHACRQPHAGVRRDRDHPDQRLGIIGSADPQPVTACDVDPPRRTHGTGSGSAVVVHGPIDDLDGKETGCIQLCRGLRRVAGVAQPLEDQVGIHRVTLRHPRNRRARCRRLQTDRPLLLVRPKPLRPTRYHALIVSTIPWWKLSITLYGRQSSDAGRLLAGGGSELSKSIASRALRSVRSTALSAYGTGLDLAAPFVPKLRYNVDVRWLFVACLPNGGSTALAKMLDGASAAFLLTPSGEGQWLVPELSAEGRRWDPNLPVNYARVRRVWLSRVALVGGQCVVIEKSPPNLCRFGALRAAFTDMQTVAIVMARDPLATCASWAKRYTPATIVRTWHPELAGCRLESDDFAFHEALGDICGRRFAMLVRAAQDAEIVTTYEAIAEAPGTFLARIAEVEPLLSDVDPDLHLSVKDYSAQPFRNLNVDDLARLSPAQVEAVARGLAPHADALAQFGYVAEPGTP